MKSERNKKICIATMSLQAVHVILYLTGFLDKVTVYIAFGICTVISIICIVMSVWLLLPFSKFKNEIKYLFVFFSIIQVISTIIIFLLPEAGFPPLIQFWITTNCNYWIRKWKYFVYKDIIKLNIKKAICG